MIDQEMKSALEAAGFNALPGDEPIRFINPKHAFDVFYLFPDGHWEHKCVRDGKRHDGPDGASLEALLRELTN